ncbi:MAG: class I SAM-dependent DNA methyltransferase [Candidatus Electrothrix scaldis]|nr:MAG: class I SAM-dependent DNA methyltransferase [Candidatus Electrothrix sp. GW3-3]
MNAETLISKVWSFCTTLRDDGVGYGDYLEQLTYLIFLKMADEYSRPPYNRDVGIPEKYTWNSLRSKKGAELEGHYITLLRELGMKKGMLGQIFTKSQNKIQDPAKLSRLVEMVNDTDWVMLDADTKGTIYEGLLEKNAEDTKSGAGQYFTPRSLIKAMVACMRPEPMQTIADPACGTGGFFLSAYDHLISNHKLDKKQKAFLKFETFSGNEIVSNTRRMCLMNMFLHNIGEIDGNSAVSANDALIAPPAYTVDMVLANPPFGKKSSMTFTNQEGEQEKDDLTYNRQDFWATTSNKQVNFVQHIRSMLKSTGRAAVVVPDNVLFFDNRPAQKEPWTKEVWFYDYRTNIHHTLKKKPLRLEHLQDFIACYSPENRHKREATWDADTNPEGRWRKYAYKEIIARDKTSLDIFWLKDKSLADLDNLPDPEDLAAEIIENIEAGLQSFREVAARLSVSDR